MQGDEFVICRSLAVLYLYDNTLMRIPLLDRNVNLSHLYLQNNRIDKIEGLDSLARLTKLYVFKGHVKTKRISCHVVAAAAAATAAVVVVRSSRYSCNSRGLLVIKTRWPRFTWKMVVNGDSHVASQSVILYHYWEKLLAGTCKTVLCVLFYFCDICITAELR